MSGREGTPPTAPRRPESTRPRTDHVDAGSAPPSRRELEAIERQQAELATQAGAAVTDDRELAVAWVRYRGRGPALNYAAVPRWSDADVARLLNEVQAKARAAGEWPVLTVCDGVSSPPDLAARLAADGWTLLAVERVMWTRHAPVVPHLDPGLRIEAVTPASALDFVRVESENFGVPAELAGERAERLGAAVRDHRLRAFVVRLIKEPVAGARLTPGDRVAALTAISVVARQRRRGYGRLVTAVATRAGLATGHGLVWLSVDETNTPALNLYRSLGYEPAFLWSRWAGPR